MRRRIITGHALQVDLDLMLKTDEPARVEWAVMANSQALDNSTRTEFDAVIDTGGLPFNTSDPRCFTELPTNEQVCMFYLFALASCRRISLSCNCLVAQGCKKLRISGPEPITSGNITAEGSLLEHPSSRTAIAARHCVVFLSNDQL